MKSQLYLWSDLRKLKKDEIRLFKDTFKDKIFPSFQDIEKEASDLQNKYYNDTMKLPCNDPDAFDAASIADAALELGIGYYEKISLMKYNTFAMWISMLYQYWEQQTRVFLYEEESHCFELEFKKFCTRGIKDIKGEFLYHKLDITKLECWKKIDELRLLCNTLKHGDGSSARKLKKKRPDLFVREGLEDIDLLKLCKSTLLKQVININEKIFYKYCDILIEFWDELPERMYSDEIQD